MKLNTLQSLRFGTPAILILLFTALSGKLTGLWQLSLPENPKDWAATVMGLVISTLYYLSGLRNWANQFWFEKVNENIRSQLIKIADLDDNTKIFSWTSIKPIFYNLIDNDKSLTINSEQAYFNGYIWTTCADVRAISFIFAVLSIFAFSFEVVGAKALIAIFVCIFGFTFLASAIATKKHMKIGNQQIKTIKLFHQTKLKEKLNEIAANSSTTVD